MLSEKKNLLCFGTSNVARYGPVKEDMQNMPHGRLGEMVVLVEL